MLLQQQQTKTSTPQQIRQTAAYAVGLFAKADLVIVETVFPG
jgi:hypothetical protein